MEDYFPGWNIPIQLVAILPFGIIKWLVTKAGKILYREVEYTSIRKQI